MTKKFSAGQFPETRLIFSALWRGNRFPFEQYLSYLVSYVSKMPVRYLCHFANILNTYNSMHIIYELVVVMYPNVFAQRYCKILVHLFLIQSETEYPGNEIEIIAGNNFFTKTMLFQISFVNASSDMALCKEGQRSYK